MACEYGVRTEVCDDSLERLAIALHGKQKNAPVRFASCEPVEARYGPAAGKPGNVEEYSDFGYFACALLHGKTMPPNDSRQHTTTFRLFRAMIFFQRTSCVGRQNGIKDGEAKC